MELAGPVPELVDASMHHKPDPFFPGFARLGQQIYLFRPSPQDRPSTTASPSDDDPDLIVFCSWMGAASKHVAKYTNVYRTKHPSSQILLLRQDGGDLFYRSIAQQIRNLEPAIRAIRAVQSAQAPKTPSVLMHIFSNGGSWTACQLADAYARSDPGAGADSSLLPLSALFLDSTPSLPNPAATFTAISELLPREPAWLAQLSKVALSGYLSSMRTLHWLLGVENPTLALRRKLNDPHGSFMQESLPRVYLYSQGDALIPAADVELHAREARDSRGEEGAKLVELQDFGQTKHVAHMPADPTRYWAIVERVWKERRS
jgi:hypothetical protein